MPVQRLSLFAPLPTRHLETVIAVIQTLTTSPTEYLTQFKTITHVYKDDSATQGQRPANFLRLCQDASDRDADIDDKDIKVRNPVVEVIDAPEINKRPVTSRIIHSVPCLTGDPTKLVLSMGYLPSFSFFEQGYSLIIGSTQLRVYRIFRASKKMVDSTDEVIDERGPGDEYEGIAIGDGATWIVHADIEVSTGSPDDLRKGTEELLRLKKELQGYADLQPLIDELR